MAITFSKATKVINITSPQTAVFIQDLINAIRDYEDNGENMELAKIANASGKQDLGGGVLVGITLELINDWRISFTGWSGPSTTSVSVGGGNLVATNQYSNNPILPTAFTQVAVQSSSSATISQLEIVNLQHMIESQRGEHAGYGDVYYWDPKTGNDTNDGSTPDSATKTWAAAETLCTDGNADIVFVSMPTGSGITITEQIVFTKNDVHLRGPGTQLRIQPTTSPAVLFSGVSSCSMENFRINGNDLDSATHFAGDCLAVSGGTQTHLTNIHVYDAPRHGFHIMGSEHTDFNSCEAARAGAHGYFMMGNTEECILTKNVARDATGDGYHLSGTGVEDIRFLDNVSHSCGGYGAVFWGTVKCYANAANYAFNCSSGVINDQGTNTGYEALDSMAAQSSGVWNTATAGNTAVGTFGEKVANKLLTFIKFMGAK